MNPLLAFLSIVLLAADRDAPRVYVSNEKSGDVSVIDSREWKVIDTIAVGKRPRGIHLDPSGKLLYVALSGSPITPPGTERDAPDADKKADGIGVIDVASNRLTTKLISGSDPEQFSLSHDGRTMYISNEDVNAVTVLDIANGKTIKQIAVGTEPEGVTTSPDGKRVFVTSETTSEIHVIDTSTNEIVGRFQTAQRPRSIAFVPSGEKAYVTCESAGVICVVDVATLKVTQQIAPPGESIRPMGVVVAPDGKHVYVTTGRGAAVIEIDTQTDQITRRLDKVGARVWGIGITPDGSTLITANGPSDDVSIIDVATFTIRSRVKVGSSPWGIEVAR